MSLVNEHIICLSKHTVSTLNQRYVYLVIVKNALGNTSRRKNTEVPLIGIYNLCFLLCKNAFN